MKHFNDRGYKTGHLFRRFHLPNVKRRYDDNNSQAENNFDDDTHHCHVVNYEIMIKKSTKCK